MVNEAKKIGDPLANLIHSMNFEKNQISILLEDIDEEDTEEMVPVEIDITLSTYQNVQNYYENKKKFLTKEKKTVQA